MKKSLLIIAFAFALFPRFSFGQINNSNEIIINNYAQFFSKAYQLHPEIPNGILEAVSFCNTRFTHLQHLSAESGSCSGIPNAYGVLIILLLFQNYRVTA